MNDMRKSDKMLKAVCCSCLQLRRGGVQTADCCKAEISQDGDVQVLVKGSLLR